MSRSTDAFSSLISDVPGVDTSCFIKRSLNDLKPKTTQTADTVSENVQQTQPEVAASSELPVQYEFGSLDLDSLGNSEEILKRKEAAKNVQLEDLFEDIPGCEVTANQTLIEEQPQPSLFHTQEKEEVFFDEQSTEKTFFEEPLTKEVSSNEVHAEEVSYTESPTKEAFFGQTSKKEVHLAESPRENLRFAESPREEDFYEDSPREEEFVGEVEIPVEESVSLEVRKKKHLKSRFEKYKSQFNKQAASLKKKGMKAMKQGIGAAQDWVDKYVDDRRQTLAASNKQKQGDKEIKRFLEDMEQISHHRRELLLREIPPEFFQRVMDYVHCHKLSVDHLFVTSHEREDDKEDEGEAQDDSSEEEKSVEEVYEAVQQSEEVKDEEDSADLLGLSAVQSAPKGGPKKPEEFHLADPDDLDSFFAGGGQASSSGVVLESPGFMGSLPLIGNEDLMEFEGGSAQQVKADYCQMYNRLKDSSQYTEEEIRMILRQKREEEKETKIQKALEAKIERDRDEVENREVLQQLKEKYLPVIVEWREKHAKNMRGLLTSLETVLWEDSGWKPLTVGDVLEPNQVKKAYMKANLIIHPDKVRQKGGSPEQVVRADMVFDVLKEGWKEFQS